MGRDLISSSVIVPYLRSYVQSLTATTLSSISAWPDLTRPLAPLAAGLRFQLPDASLNLIIRETALPSMAGIICRKHDKRTTTDQAMMQINDLHAVIGESPPLRHRVIKINNLSVTVQVGSHFRPNLWIFAREGCRREFSAFFCFPIIHPIL